MPGQDNIIHTLVDTIQGSVDQFNESLSGVEQRLVDEILEITKELEVSASGKIKNSIANLRLIMRIKNKLQKVIVSKKYQDSIREFIKTFETVAGLQNQYFKNYISSKKAQLPEEKLKLIREYSINNTIASLTESGLNVNILDKVEDIIRQNTTTGGSYSSLQGQLRDFILSDKNTDGALARYTKTITTDAINQYSRQYMETTAEDLNMPWRKYLGSLKTTSREWCEKMVAKKFVHVSELPELVKGNIDGHQCGIYKKTADNKGTDLPYGMIAGTNAQNVLVRAGGHGCEHGFYPCDEDEVPKEVLDRFKTKQLKIKKKEVGKDLINELRGKMFDMGNRQKFIISRGGIDHALGKSWAGGYNNLKIEILSNLKYILTDTKYSRFEKDYKDRPDILGAHILSFKYNKNNYEIVVRKTRDGANIFYDIRPKK